MYTPSRATRKNLHVAQLSRGSLLTRCISQPPGDASPATRHNFSEVLANLTLLHFSGSLGLCRRISFSARRIRSLSSGRREGLEEQEKLRVFRIASTCGPRLISGDECHFLNSSCFPLSLSPSKKSFSSIIAPAPCARRRRIISVHAKNVATWCS